MLPPLEKVRLLAGMGKQERRNIPGLLRYLLAEDCHHYPGRAQGGTVLSDAIKYKQVVVMQ